MKIVVDNKIPFLKGVLEPWATIRYLPGKEITREEIIDADAIVVRTRTECNQNLLEGTRVKFIASATIGYDHIDTKYCHENQITWTNAPGCNASSVRQYVASALITLSQQFGFKPADKTLGIIGVGNVGAKIESLALDLGMKVLLNDPPRERNEGGGKFVSISTLLEQSDITTLHVPLNNTGLDKTYRMVDQTFLTKMKEGGFLINTSRGKVIDEIALKEAVRMHTLKGTVLDVWDNEPKLDSELLHMAFIGTPHIAGYSQDGKANGTSIAVQSLSWYFNFDLHDWYPEDIPLPATQSITIDCNGKDLETIIGEVFLQSYSIEEDDKRLKQDPDKFEELRGNYPVRREFPAHTVKLLSSRDEIVTLVKKCGFKIEEQ